MKKKQNYLILTIIAAAILFNLVTVVMIPLRHFSIAGLVISTITSIEHLAVLYYLFIGHKKPHGNMLRFVMLLFALTLGTELVVSASAFSTLDLALSVVTALFIPYIAGRLNKINQNKILITIVLILFIIGAVSYCISIKPQTLIDYFRIFGETIEWFAISSAYFVRYKEHKEAGLADAPKNI